MAPGCSRGEHAYRQIAGRYVASLRSCVGRRPPVDGPSHIGARGARGVRGRGRAGGATAGRSFARRSFQRATYW